MFDINKEGDIQLVRGDTLVLSLFINAGTEVCPQRYTLKGDDVVYFAIMEVNQLFEDAIFKKTFDSNSTFNEDGDLLIMLSSDDTANLREGLYKYTIKLKVGTGNSFVLKTL